ncbi:GTPase domain-containing protein [Nocardioides sp. HDW12B]|uniref:GTPase domain-containing protein n=1 Tax=Nocardioides sp. HDW12B TaxID=2714939 RepID=UPI00197E05E4|nr:GTPase domain-containing protein [Nocardioides sp. HDW12B]
MAAPPLVRLAAGVVVTGLESTLTDLRDALTRVRLPLETPEAARHRAARDEVVGQLDDYVLPRLRQIDAPLLAVVGGSTGAGKSTMVNSLVGRRVSEPGVLRPTTRAPVLVCHPDDVAWFDDDRVLPDLARSHGPSQDPGAVQVVTADTVPRGLAVMDAPDIDSVEVRNRALASQLLAAADLWLFVTSAARYADQVPWDFLRAAAERSAAVAIVLDRTPPAAVDEVGAHLREMMDARDLAASPLFTVAEVGLDGEGLLPAQQTAPIAGWLHDLAADSDARASVVRQTLEGAVESVVRRARGIAEAHGDQRAAVQQLHQDVARSYDRARREVGEASADGSLLRGELLARWQEFVGAGDLMRSVESKVGWLRDRVTGFFRGQPAQVDRVTSAVETGLEALLVEHAEAAAERARDAWDGSTTGRQVLSEPGARDLGRASREFRGAAERVVRDWQRAVVELVREEGQSRRTTARFLAFGVNGLAVALMIVVFVSTAGMTGAEVGIAGGSAVLGQKLLEAVFGDQAVRRLTELSRRDLEERVAAAYDGERARWDEVLAALGVRTEDGERLDAAVGAVERSRVAEPEARA